MSSVGIDVSQATLDVAVSSETDATRWQVANTPEGIGHLVMTLHDVDCSQIALEPTGPYHLPVVAALVQAGLPVSAVGPAEVHAYRTVLSKRNKTDAADAELLAQYAWQHAARLRPIQLAPPHQRALRALVRYRDQVIDRRVRLENQRHSTDWEGNARVLDWQAEDIDRARQREAQLTSEIRTLLTAFPEAAILQEFSGVGPLTAAAVLAYLPIEIWGHAKAAAAFAGVIPEIRASGNQQRSHLTARGHRRLRRMLYNAVGSAMRCNEDIKAYRAHLLAKGKSKKSARCAAAHRLLRHMMGRLRVYYAQQTPRAA